MTYIDYPNETIIETDGKVTGTAKLRNNISELVIGNLEGAQDFDYLIRIISMRTSKLKDVGHENEDSLMDHIEKIVRLQLDENQIRRLHNIFRKIIRHDKSTYSGNQFYEIIKGSVLPFRYDFLAEACINDPYYNNKGNAVDHFLELMAEKYGISNKIRYSYIPKQLLEKKFEIGDSSLDKSDKEKLLAIFSHRPYMENNGQYKALWVLIYFNEASNIGKSISTKLKDVSEDLKLYLSRHGYKEKTDVNITNKLDLIILMLKSMILGDKTDKHHINILIDKVEMLKKIEYISEPDINDMIAALNAFTSFFFRNKELVYCKQKNPIISGTASHVLITKTGIGKMEASSTMDDSGNTIYSFPICIFGSNPNADRRMGLDGFIRTTLWDTIDEHTQGYRIHKREMLKIIKELLKNSLDHTHDEAYFGIRIKRYTENENILISMIIADRGGGISENVRKAVGNHVDFEQAYEIAKQVGWSSESTMKNRIDMSRGVGIWMLGEASKSIDMDVRAYDDGREYIFNGTGKEENAFKVDGSIRFYMRLDLIPEKENVQKKR